MTAIAEDAINRRARGIDRAFEILDFLRQHREPIRPNEIAAQMGAPRSSIYELVNLLIRNGILEYRGDDGRVFLGRKLYFLGVAYAEEYDLIRECNELLTKIAQDTRETAQPAAPGISFFTASSIRSRSASPSPCKTSP